jgi:nucleotide-binding universal stress UspA family protein
LVRPGEPVRAITETVQELGADLIVLPTPGRPRLWQALIGSVAERFAGAAPCPVLIVNREQLSTRVSAETDSSTRVWKHVVVPVDFSDCSRQAVRYAATLAAQCHAQLTLREFSCRLATNGYVFYGALLLAGSLVVGALTRGDEVWWRTAASLGIATVLIGFIHAWLDARTAREDSRSSRRRRAKQS